MTSWSRGAARVLGGGLMGLGGVAAATEPPHALLPNVQQEVLASQARELVSRPFADQAANGAVVDQTVWNYHFESDVSARMHTNAYFLLDRLARRQVNAGGGCLRLHVQRAQTHPGEVPLAELAQRRLELDNRRLDAITVYMQQAWPGMAFTVQLYDPSPVGMSAVEATMAANKEQGTAFGFIPAGFRAVQTSTKGESAGSSTGFFPEPQVPVQRGAGGASALGASAGVERVVTPITP